MFKNNIRRFHFHIRTAAVTVIPIGSVDRESHPRPTTFYYLGSYFAGCLLANRIVTRVPFGWVTMVDSSNSWYREPSSMVLDILDRAPSPPSCLIIRFVPRTCSRGKRKNEKMEKQNDLGTRTIRKR